MAFKVKEEQIECIVEFMEEHKDFATGRLSVANSREQFRKLWVELATKLNSLGLGEKSLEKWQKTWSHYKGNLKKKAAEVKKYREETGGGPQSGKKLSTLETRALGLLGETFYAGCGIQERVLSSVVHQNIEDDSIALTSISTPTSSSLKRKMEQIVHNETTAPASSGLGDHDYLLSITPGRTPKKQATEKTDMAHLYKETLTCLKNIEHTMGKGLQSIADKLRQNLEQMKINCKCRCSKLVLEDEFDDELP